MIESWCDCLTIIITMINYPNGFGVPIFISVLICTNSNVKGSFTPMLLHKRLTEKPIKEHIK